MILNASDFFSYGTGPGNDLAPAYIKFYERYANIVDINERMLLYEDTAHEITVDDYEQRIDVYINPGFFYLGDRECYAYNTKCTQVSQCTLSGTAGIIPLVDFPDGYAPSEYEHMIEPWARDGMYGVSPVIVRKHPAHVMSSISVPYDVAIYSDTGISGEVGYRIVDNAVVSGETEFPWYFSPLDRFAKSYDPWRSDLIVPPDMLSYDVATNSIIIKDPDLESEYVIEFETRNEPFNIGKNISPLFSYPENSIICIEPDSIPDESVPGSISVYVDDEYCIHGQAVVTAEVLSEQGNRLPNYPVEFYIIRDNFICLPDVLPEPLEGRLFYSSGEVWYDEIDLPVANVWENNIKISGQNRVALKAYIHSIGYLTASGEPGYHVSGTTDEYGIVHAVYTKPGLCSHGRSLTVVAKAGSFTATGSIILPSICSGSVYAAEPVQRTTYTFRYPDISGEVTGFIVPSGCVVPSSLGICTAESFLSSLHESSSPSFSYPNTIEIADDVLYAMYQVTSSGEPFVTEHFEWENLARMDRSVCYG